MEKHISSDAKLRLSHDVNAEIDWNQKDLTHLQTLIKNADYERTVLLIKWLQEKNCCKKDELEWSADLKQLQNNYLNIFDRFDKV